MKSRNSNRLPYMDKTTGSQSSSSTVHTRTTSVATTTTTSSSSTTGSGSSSISSNTSPGASPWSSLSPSSSPSPSPSPPSGSAPPCARGGGSGSQQQKPQRRAPGGGAHVRGSTTHTVIIMHDCTQHMMHNRKQKAAAAAATCVSASRSSTASSSSCMGGGPYSRTGTGTEEGRLLWRRTRSGGGGGGDSNGDEDNTTWDYDDYEEEYEEDAGAPVRLVLHSAPLAGRASPQQQGAPLLPTAPHPGGGGGRRRERGGAGAGGGGGGSSNTSSNSSGDEDIASAIASKDGLVLGGTGGTAAVSGGAPRCDISNGDRAAMMQRPRVYKMYCGKPTQLIVLLSRRWRLSHSITEPDVFQAMLSLSCSYAPISDTEPKCYKCKKSTDNEGRVFTAWVSNHTPEIDENGNTEKYTAFVKSLCSSSRDHLGGQILFVLTLGGIAFRSKPIHLRARLKKPRVTASTPTYAKTKRRSSAPLQEVPPESRQPPTPSQTVIHPFPLDFDSRVPAVLNAPFNGSWGTTPPISVRMLYTTFSPVMLSKVLSSSNSIKLTGVTTQKFQVLSLPQDPNIELLNSSAIPPPSPALSAENFNYAASTLMKELTEASRHSTVPLATASLPPSPPLLVIHPQTSQNPDRHLIVLITMYDSVPYAMHYNNYWGSVQNKLILPGAISLVNIIQSWMP
ncbi:hypothetical protein Pelo_17023 [Pelomyxa schiedti]|nr:hypothetical protein Pelo_17023 [Pelomyxa schiedti]